MYKDKIRTAVEILSNLIKLSKEKKDAIIEKYSEMDEKTVIKDLSQAAYQLFGKDEAMFSYALDVIRNINTSICPSVPEMRDILLKMFSNEVEGNMSLEENHQLVNSELVRFTQLLNQYGIDYYVVGALPCFIKTGVPLFRYHDDIDIMVNENDLPKVSEIVSMCGYKFNDDRFPTFERFKEMEQDKPPHTILAQNPNNEFHIGFFTFRREEDQSITMTEYSHHLENDRVVVDVLERRTDPIGTLLIYDDTPINYNGTSFRTSTVESVYLLKSYTRRPKDITDMQKLEPHVTKYRLDELKKHPTNSVQLTDVKKNTPNEPIIRNI